MMEKTRPIKGIGTVALQQQFRFAQELKIADNIDRKLQLIIEGQHRNLSHDKFMSLFGKKHFLKMTNRLVKIKRSLREYDLLSEDEVRSTLEKLLNIQSNLKWDIILLKKAFKDEPEKLKEFGL